MIFEIENQDLIEINNIDKTDSFIVISDYSYVSYYVLVDNFYLVVDSFNKRMFVFTMESFFECFSLENGKITGLVKYMHDHIKKDLKLYLETANKNHIIKKEAMFQNDEYVLCLTYSCNSACVYCYEKTIDGQKNLITLDNLQIILDYIKNRSLSNKKNVRIELFGGEPLLKELYPQVQLILNFCRLNNIYVSITTNAVELDNFLPLLVAYRKYITLIQVTIDGTEEIHNRRRLSVLKDKSFKIVIENIQKVIFLDINVQISINLDADNINNLSDFLTYYSSIGFDKEEKINLILCRVDNRLYDSKYKYSMSESELLKSIIKIENELSGFPQKTRLSFLKSSFYMAKKIGYAYNQDESGRGDFSYCWACSEIDSVLYIDSLLNIYRCTYSVGALKYKIGSVLEPNHINSKMFILNNLSTKYECSNCKISNFCSGGCCLSVNENKEKFCRDELTNYEYFINNILIPWTSERLTGVIK